MKLRNGFVSNSSTSSFIAVGFFGKHAKFPSWYDGESESDMTYEEQELYNGLFPNAKEQVLTSDEIGDLMDNLHDDLSIGSEEDLWGVNLAYWSDDNYEIKKIDLGNVVDKARQEVIDLCTKYSIQIDPKNIHVYTGMVSS